MKGLVKLLAITALAGMALSVFSMPALAEDKKIDYGAFEEDDPRNISAAAILAKMEAAEFTGSTGTLKYRIYKSPAYKTKAEDTPALMLVFLHGSGGKGDDNELQIKDQVTMVNYMVSDLGDTLFADIPFVVIAPQCPVETQWAKSSYSTGSYSIDDIEISNPMQLVYELVVDMQKTEGITTDNTVIGGISMGGYGTWDLGLRHPEICGGLIPMCGGGDPTKASLIKDKRIWAFHGDKDTAVPVSASRDMDAALKEAGATNYKYTEMAGVTHNVWSPAMTEVKDPYLLQWLFEGITYSVTTELEGEGDVTKSVNGVKRGETVKIVLEPADGYTYGKVYLDGKEINPVVPQDGVAYVELKDINKNYTVKAVFDKLPEESSEDPAPVEPPKKGLSKGALLGIIGGAVALVGAAAAVIISKKKKK